MSQGEDPQLVPQSINAAVLEDLENTDYLHAVLDLAGPPVASGSRTEGTSARSGNQQTSGVCFQRQLGLFRSMRSWRPVTYSEQDVYRTERSDRRSSANTGTRI